MKEKVLPFIIGVLVGAIIASAGFMIYINTHKIGRKHDFNRPLQMNQSQDSSSSNGTPPELPNGEKPSENPNGETTNNNANSTDAQNNEQTQSNS